MPDGEWKDARDAKGRVYYYNVKTGKSQWEKPEALFTVQESLLSKHGWKVSKTPEGKIYYYHTESGKSQWDVPQFADENLSKSEAKNIEDVPQTAYIEKSSEAEVKVVPSMVKVKNDQRDVSNLMILNPERKSKEEAEKEFIEMLQQNQVDSTWSFSKIISELGATDPRYWIVDDDPLWKQDVFDKYLTNRTEDQLLKERTETEKFKEAFEQMLRGKNQIKYYTRWSTVRRWIANEPIYKHSVVKEAVKRKTFQDYVKRLKEEREESIKSLKEQAIKELHEYLSNILLNPENRTKNKEDIPILTLQQLLNSYLFEKNKRFMANKHFKILTHADVLKVYLEILGEEEKTLHDKWRALSECCYTRDRIARDNFKGLLREPKLRIRANSNWNDVYPHFKNDERFLQLLGTDGSNALDFFLDYVEELNITIGAHRSMAQTLLIDKKFQWQDDDTKNRSGLIKVLEQNPNFEKVDKIDMDLVIDQLLKVRKEKLIQEAEVQQRILDQKKHLFKLMLHRLYRNLASKPTWEAAYHQLEQTVEFKELASSDVSLKDLYEEFLAECSSIGPHVNTTIPKVSKKRPLTPSIELDY